MRRREFITLLGSMATAWPLAARAQQPERMRRIGVLTPWPANDAEARDRVTAFAQALQLLGWVDGKNVRIDYRLADGKADTMRSRLYLLQCPELIISFVGSALCLSAPCR